MKLGRLFISSPLDQHRDYFFPGRFALVFAFAFVAFFFAAIESPPFFQKNFYAPCMLTASVSHRQYYYTPSAQDIAKNCQLLLGLSRTHLRIRWSGSLEHR